MWQELLNTYLDNFHKNETLVRQFKSLKTNQERVEFCFKRNEPTKAHMTSVRQHYVGQRVLKNDEFSEKYREIGNDFYRNKQFSKAYDNYMMAFIYAPLKSEKYFLALANRSAVLFEAKMYKLCLNDLNQLKTENNGRYPVNLLKKLQNRELNCLLYFAELKDDQNKSNKGSETLLKQVNKKYPNMSDSVRVEYSAENGRYCVANDDINGGENLFYETPYSAILLPQFNHNYCDYCFKQTKSHDSRSFNYLNTQTCDTCVNVLYCSNDCKLNSKPIHRYECSILDLLYDLGIAHLAYRIITNTDLCILRKYFGLNLSLSNYYGEFSKENNGKPYMSIDYDTVYNLVTNEEFTHVDDLYQYTLTAIFLGNMYVSMNDNYGDLNQISSLILRHILQTICNAHALTRINDEVNEEDDADEPTNVINLEQQRYATAIYPTVSIMNHSCKPNVMCSFIENTNKILIKSTQVIKRSDQIWNCYGPHYLKMADAERRTALYEQYHFKCKCDYCDSNGDATKHIFIFKCLQCAGLCLQFGTCSCKFVNTIDKYVGCIRTAKDHFKMKSMKSDEILKNSMNALKFYKKVLFSNSLSQLQNVLTVNKEKIFKNSIDYIDYCKVLDDVARIKCEEGDFKAASVCLSESIELLKGVYTFDSNANQIEIALELFKLAEILCNSREFQNALNRIDEAIAIATECLNSNNSVFKRFLNLKGNILKCI